MDVHKRRRSAATPRLLPGHRARAGFTSSWGPGTIGEPYLDATLVDRSTVDALADAIVRDLQTGVGDTGDQGRHHRRDRLRSMVDRARGALPSARPLGRTWPRAPPSPRMPRAGLSGWRSWTCWGRRASTRGESIIGHCDMVPDPGYHLALAGRGAWVQFDTVQGGPEYDTERPASASSPRSSTRASATGSCSLTTSACAPTWRPWAVPATPTC